MAYFRCMGNGGSTPTVNTIERLCKCSENSSSSRDTDHQHIAYFGDGVGTITQDTNYSEYLSYDSTTKKFTVLKNFVALIIPWTFNYSTASSTYSHGEFYVNDIKVLNWESSTRTQGYFEGRCLTRALVAGDTFYCYTPVSDGYPEQNLKVYNLNTSTDSASVLNEAFDLYSGYYTHLNGGRVSS